MFRPAETPCGGLAHVHLHEPPPASDANPFTTNHRILNHTIPKNPAAASHHARGLAIAPERKYRFIQNSENVTVSSRTQSPRDMTSRPSNTHIMTINHVPGLRPDATQNLRSNTEPQKGATLPITAPTEGGQPKRDSSPKNCLCTKKNRKSPFSVLVS